MIQCCNPPPPFLQLQNAAASSSPGLQFGRLAGFYYLPSPQASYIRPPTAICWMAASEDTLVTGYDTSSLKQEVRLKDPTLYCLTVDGLNESKMIEGSNYERSHH